MILFSSNDQCCGCGACASICPKHAITMQQDEYGFQFPKVDAALCVNCALCTRVCDFQNEKAAMKPLEVYAVMRRDTDALVHSASGGAFAAIAETVIESGGVVFGAVLTEENALLTPIHCMAESKQELSAIYGSKYVQSDLRNTFSEAKNQLESGRTVLFSGTPCQIGGLRAYLSKDYPNLITMDLVCHGVPSAKMFQDYLRILQKKLKGRMTSFCFRHKTEGGGFIARVECMKKDGSVWYTDIPSYQSSYYEYFLRSELYRHSCYHCPYAGNQHPADITIGDYWGFEAEHPEVILPKGEMSPPKGISVLIANTLKGIEWFTRCRESFFVVPSQIESAARHNGQLRQPSKHGAERERILKLYASKGYKAVDNAFIRRKKAVQIKERMQYLVHHYVPKPLRKLIK